MSSGLFDKEFNWHPVMNSNYIFNSDNDDDNLMSNFNKQFKWFQILELHNNFNDMFTYA